MDIATSTIGSTPPVRRAAVILMVMPVCLLLIAQAALATPGAELWVKRYDGPVNNDDYARDMGVSPDGSTVFVTGSSVSDDTIDDGYDYTTIAYNAPTGAKHG